MQHWTDHELRDKHCQITDSQPRIIMSNILPKSATHPNRGLGASFPSCLTPLTSSSSRQPLPEPLPSGDPRTMKLGFSCFFRAHLVAYYRKQHGQPRSLLSLTHLLDDPASALGSLLTFVSVRPPMFSFLVNVSDPCCTVCPQDSPPPRLARTPQVRSWETGRSRITAADCSSISIGFHQPRPRETRRSTTRVSV